jgi:hypothetical protein
MRETKLPQKVNGKINLVAYMTTNHSLTADRGSGVPRNFFRGGVQQIQLRTEGREKGDLGAVAP